MERNMETENIKKEAYRLLNDLPEHATWDDLMYKIYVRQSIESGLKDSNTGNLVDVTTVRKRFGLPE